MAIGPEQTVLLGQSDMTKVSRGLPYLARTKAMN